MHSDVFSDISQSEASVKAQVNAGYEEDTEKHYNDSI